MITVNIIRDSVNPAGMRLTTAIWTYPKYIHGEVMTHRALSKNASSSRAIPTAKMLDWVRNDPAMPLTYPKNQAGMQAAVDLSPGKADACRTEIFDLRDLAVRSVDRLTEYGLHKQNANRYLEPWLHMTTLISGTDWNNLFALRVHKDAQPEFQRLAYLMLRDYIASEPEELKEGEWHLPFREQVPPGLDDETLIKVCMGRCARVSYKNQDGVYSTADDIKLHDRLVAQHPGHWTPAEHIAQARNDRAYSNSNFRGWTQYRKMFPNENIRDLDLVAHLRAYEISKDICPVCHGEGSVCIECGKF